MRSRFRLYRWLAASARYARGLVALEERRAVPGGALSIGGTNFGAAGATPTGALGGVNGVEEQAARIATRMAKAPGAVWRRPGICFISVSSGRCASTARFLQLCYFNAITLGLRTSFTHELRMLRLDAV